MPKKNFWPEPPKKVGNRYEYGSLTFWAEGGGVYVIDSEPKPGETSDPKPIMLPGWRDRTIGNMKLLDHIERSKHVGSPSEIAWKTQYCRAIKGLVEAMFEVGRQAVHQGDLTDQNVQRYYREHVATVKQTHLVPGAILPN